MTIYKLKYYGDIRYSIYFISELLCLAWLNSEKNPVFYDPTQRTDNSRNSLSHWFITTINVLEKI